MSATTALKLSDHDDGSGHEAQEGISNVILGMILFICSEVMFFAGLFAAYFNVRANAPIWPPEGNEHFHVANEIALPLIITTLLIISSFTCQLAVWSIRKGDRQGLIRNIAVTVVLGVIFLIGQGYDYTQLGFTLADGTFGTTFFTLTGFHGAHVLGGVIMLSVVLYRAMAGQFSNKHHDMVEAVSLYWHFVDVVWIVLFSLLYLVPTAG